YIRITSFQESTAKELDEALDALQPSGFKALILDLRGNSGGLFEVAVEVARRFLSSGVIVSTQTNDPRFSAIYHARNLAAMNLPWVVVVDGDTASSAEVVAGALKDNKRARLVGQPTFGKGCLQGLLRLGLGQGTSAGGIRITIAKFFSPSGQPYSGRGI